MTDNFGLWSPYGLVQNPYIFRKIPDHNGHRFVQVFLYFCDGVSHKCYIHQSPVICDHYGHKFDDYTLHYCDGISLTVALRAPCLFCDHITSHNCTTIYMYDHTMVANI